MYKLNNILMDRSGFAVGKHYERGREGDRGNQDDGTTGAIFLEMPIYI